MHTIMYRAGIGSVVTSNAQPAARLRYLPSFIVPRGVVHPALLVAPVRSIRVYQFAMYR